MPETEIHRWKEERLSHWFASSIAGGFARALRGLDRSGADAAVCFEPQHPNPDLWRQWQDPRWFALAAGGAEGAALSLGCAAETVRLLAAGIAGESDLPEEKALESYREVLRQAAGALGAAASEKLGREIRFSEPEVASGPPRAALGVEFRFRLSDTNHLLAVIPNEALLQAILEDAVPLKEPAKSSEPEAGLQFLSNVSEERESATQILDPAAKYNLELLLEVDLEFSVSFGRTRLPLDDVLKLTSGAIVELNRSVTDPVDLLINDVVIARGEVVVVDGNYGIRITEVVSRKERIRSIF